MRAEYLQALWGESLDHPTYSDVLTFIEKLKESDEEHGAFWVGMEDEFTLEVHQDLTVILVDSSDLETRCEARNWDEVRSYFNLFFSGDRGFINKKTLE